MFQVVYQYYTKNGKNLIEKVEKFDSYALAEVTARLKSIIHGKAYLVSGGYTQVKEEFRNGDYVDNDPLY